ncbi:phosphatidylglycerol--membrane-oligosaccharide glycerophosphotransferase [Citrobacter cronae]|uniref:phosphatidylglycerol--membrane-oligosaccharide glycerophosphotransferase n=1 Tax=Citrobacter cronae TaxID=1748967 RepID=UPI001957D1C6|nr:phosphatidylglycerol--membrane-oligosaccharide glycerophosphotransferase [Citrobacter cronae]
MQYSFVAIIISLASMILAALIYKSKGYRAIYYAFLILLAQCISLFLSLFWLGCYYFTGEGVNDAVIYTLTRSLYSADFKDYVAPFVVAVLLIGLLLFLSWRFMQGKNVQKERKQYVSITAVLLTFFAVGISPALLQFTNYNKPPAEVDGSDFSRYYITPDTRINNPKYNLVYIYAESLERTYFDKDTFPQLLPDLTALKQDGLDFSGTEQYPATDFTIAGIVASQCGLPLFAPTDLSGKKASLGFFSSSVCLGDILKNSGYETWFMQGADLRFADKDVFFKTHGIDHAWGLAESGLEKDFSAQNAWGLYDDMLLEKVWRKFEHLSRQKTPFALFTLTLDTHPPEGYIPTSCPVSYKKNGSEVDALTSVLCSQREIAKFIRRIQASPWASNTIIVLSSDHLVMQNMTAAVDYLNKMPRRNLFVVFRNGVTPKVIADKRSTLDHGATVLELMGGDNAIGLGRSSLSQPSLAAVFDDFKNKLLAWGPAIRSRWGIPESIKNFTVDTRRKLLRFDSFEYPIPALLEVSPGRVWPVVDDGNDVGMSLRNTLGFLPEGHKFIWIDQCLSIGPVWQPDSAVNTGWCVASGKAGSETHIEKITAEDYSGGMSEFPGKTNHERFQRIQARLLLSAKDVRYQSDRILFAAEGLPAFVKSITGVGHPEYWGRWSDANLSPAVAITYNQPLPAKFDVEIKAKAFGKNIGAPLPVSIGSCTHYLTLHAEAETVILHMTNPDRLDTLTIVPPYPELSNEGNYIGFPKSAPPRKLGIGLTELRIIPVND